MEVPVALHFAPAYPYFSSGLKRKFNVHLLPQSIKVPVEVVFMAQSGTTNEVITVTAPGGKTDIEEKTQIRSYCQSHPAATDNTISKIAGLSFLCSWSNKLVNTCLGCCR